MQWRRSGETKDWEARSLQEGYRGIRGEEKIREAARGDRERGEG